MKSQRCLTMFVALLLLSSQITQSVSITITEGSMSLTPYKKFTLHVYSDKKDKHGNNIYTNSPLVFGKAYHLPAKTQGFFVYDVRGNESTHISKKPELVYGEVGTKPTQISGNMPSKNATYRLDDTASRVFPARTIPAHTVRAHTVYEEYENGKTRIIPAHTVPAETVPARTDIVLTLTQVS